MICRVSRGIYGLSDYLISGKRADSKLTRNQKDNVTSIYGDLETFKIAEKYVNENKHYKSNYLHITLSFSPNECKILNQMDETQKIEKLSNISKDYLKYYTQGNNLENEVIAYAEIHEPKEQALYNEQGKQRLTHIHIGINLHNFETDKKIKPPFFNATKDKIFTQQIIQKYELEMPMPKENRVKNYQTQAKQLRNFICEMLKDKDSNYLKTMYLACKSRNLPFFKYEDKEIFLKEVKTKKNNYYKAVYKNFKGKEMAINLRGRGFERFDLKLNPPQIAPKVTHSVGKNKSNEIKSSSYKEKIFFKMYGSALNKEHFQNIFIDTTHNNFFNNNKSIDILDNGDKLTARGTDIREQIKLMLDIAEAKKWDLESLTINGSEVFKAEARRQIYERTFEKRLQNSNNLSLDAEAQSSQTTRTYNPLDTAKRLQNTKNQKYDINLIKAHYTNQRGGAGSALLMDLVTDIKFVEKIGLKLENYAIDGDKLKNKKTGRSFNVIDFLNKEAKLPLQKALEWLENNRLESIGEQKQKEKNTEIRIIETTKTPTEQPKTTTTTDDKPHQIDEAIQKFKNTYPHKRVEEQTEPSRAEQIEKTKKKIVKRPRQRNHSNDYDFSL